MQKFDENKGIWKAKAMVFPIFDEDGNKFSLDSLDILDFNNLNKANYSKFLFNLCYILPFIGYNILRDNTEEAIFVRQNEEDVNIFRIQKSLKNIKYFEYFSCDDRSLINKLLGINNSNGIGAMTNLGLFGAFGFLLDYNFELSLFLPGITLGVLANRFSFSPGRIFSNYLIDNSFNALKEIVLNYRYLGDDYECLKKALMPYSIYAGKSYK